MAELNRVIDEAVARQDLPFAVAMTANADSVTWSGAAAEAAPAKAAAQGTVFRIFSMTKAVGSTAAMNLMDRGKLKPDTMVESVLPAKAWPLCGPGRHRAACHPQRSADRCTDC